MLVLLNLSNIIRIIKQLIDNNSQKKQRKGGVKWLRNQKEMLLVPGLS
jgi:hypothetical protein